MTKVSNTQALNYEEQNTAILEQEGVKRDKELLQAFYAEDVEAVKQLLKPQNGIRGADVNTTDEFGRTLYHLAKRWGYVQIAAALREQGGRIILKNKDAGINNPNQHTRD